MLRIRMDPYHFAKLDTDPHESEMQDPDPHQCENLEASEGHFGTLEVPNLDKSEW